MKDNYDLEWNDDAFGGDIDFDDDFDMDPYKNKGFFAAAATGFLDTAVNQTVGSSDAIIRTARTFLPSSFSNFLDRVSYLKDKSQELAQEFKENNYESVKSLQSIAKNITNRIGNENSLISQKLSDFSETDFSAWEKLGSVDENSDIPVLQELNQEVIDEELSKLVSAQSEAFQNVADGLNQMQAHVGGGIVAAIKGGNKELIGVQASVRDLLNYQRNVQYKMDQAKVELLARTYLVNAKYYKFMESALHTSIKELKKITMNTGKSDYEKTTLYNETKAQARKTILGAVGKRVGGLVGELRSTFGKDNRKNAYNVFESLLGNVDDALNMSDGIGLSRGMVGDIVGRMVADRLITQLPNIINQGPFAKMFSNMFAGNPELKQKFDTNWGKVKNAGNIASYNANNGLGLLNYYSQYWKDFDEYQYEDYDDYVEQTREKGKKPMPRAAFTVFNSLGNQGKGFVNRYMSRVTTARGTQYSLQQRDAKTLTQVSQWREINNITLNDVIPGWLSRIYESIERFRTGNDDFTAPVFSYNRGQFVNRKTARQIVENDVFNHSSFQNAALNARNIVNTIDNNGNLTEEQRQKLALRIIQDADKEFGFNPYYYTGEIEGFDPQLQSTINTLIRGRFGIDDAALSNYDNADMFGKLKMAGLGFKGENAATLNTLGSLVNGLKSSIPDIGKSFTNNRQAGNEQILRDLGLIFTKDGVDRMDMNVFWNRINEYIKDPYNPMLRGEYEDIGEGNAGSSRGMGSFNRSVRNTTNNITSFPGESLKAFNESVEKFTQTVTDLTANLSKMDLSQVQVDLGTVPNGISSLQSVLEKIDERDEKKYALIEQMTACVCRQAGGWGMKTDVEKKNILREEKQGKRSILERLKTLNPKGMFNKAVETLIDNQPLVLGGIIGGIGTLAIHNPKAAALLTGGIAIASLYGRLSDLSKGEMPNDDEDIYDETGTVILHAAKLRTGDYYDVASKKVIKTWKDIKGAVLDIATKTYTTVAQLTGRLFGPDGRALIITGLSKARDALNAVWNKIDLKGNLSKAWNKGKEMFYQQDVYVKGEKDPRLTRSGFMNGRYYCYDLTSKQPTQIKGWNDIKGPVYSIDAEGNLTQIISESEIAQGLVTASGMTLDKLGKATSWLGSQALTGLLKAKDYALDKGGVIRDKVGNPFKNDFTGIESRLDRIYYLLCDQFGVTPSVIPMGDGTATTSMVGNDDPINDIISGVTGASAKNSGNRSSHYPNKIRLNSLQDQEIKEEKKKRDSFYEDIHSISENMEGGNSDEKEGKEKKGLFGKIGGLLMGGVGMLKKMFTNPLGFVAGLTGMMFKSILKSPLRLISIGNLLFKGALGVASPIYKLMTWGFSGLMFGLRKLLMNDALGGLGDFLGGKKRKKRRKKGGRSRGKFNIKMPGKLGSIMKLGATVGLGTMAYSQFSDGSEGSVSQSIANSNSGSFDDFYEGGDYDDPNGQSSSSDEGSFLGDVGEMAAWSLGPWAMGKAGGSLFKRYQAGRGARAGGGMVKAGEKGLGKVGAKAVGKAGARAIPFLGELLMALDGIMGAADSEAVSNVFNTNYLTGGMHMANGITDMLDLGGLVSGVMNSIADSTGIDALRQEGGMTRLVEQSLNTLARFPIFGSAFKVINFLTHDISTPQRKIRLAMYGVEGTDNELAMAIEKIEQTLEPYVLFDGRKAWLDPKAPVKELISSLVKLSPEETTTWWKLRFEPVYKTWQSAIRIGGSQSLFEFDQEKGPKVLKIAEQVRGAITGLRPYPLDVMSHIDPNIPIMNRVKAEGIISKYLSELREEYGDKLDSEGNLKIENTIRSSQEYKEGKSEDDGFFSSIRNYFQQVAEERDEANFPTSATVMEIDISDLHKDEKTPIDEITLIRLAAYGNDENNPIRVDAVLRLERYCERFFTYQNGMARFTGKIGDIYSLFKNSFRTTEYWQDLWVKWFNKRFLPVLTVWCSHVYRLRKTTPQKGWKSLTATNKLEIANSIISIKVTVDNEIETIWDVEESPFMGYKSGTDVSVTKPFIDNLESKAVEAKLKTPEKEMLQSRSSNLADVPETANRNTDTNEVKQALKTGGALGNLFGDVIKQNRTGLPNGVGMTGSVSDNSGAQFSGDSAGSFAGTAIGDYQPNATVTNEGFEMPEKEAMKTIINEFVKAGITDNRVIAFALANAKSETAFKGRAESMNYTPGSLLSTFGNFKRNPSLAEQFGRTKTHKADQRRIANIAYGGRYGNNRSDDGWLYRGRGFTQLTFKDNYRAVANAINDPSIVNNPEKVTNDPVTAAKTAVGFFKINPGIMTKIKQGDIYGAAKMVGKHEQGARNKVNFYPEFLKRLTQGDLKGILTNSEKSEENKPETDNNIPVSDIPPDQLAGSEKVNVAPIPQLGQSNPNDTISQAAANVNLPTSGNITESISPISNSEISSESVTASKPENQENGAPSPVSSPNQPSPNTPVNSTVVQPVTPVTPQEVTLPKGTIPVRDEAVASAIAGLADAISRTLGAQGPNNRRVTVGSRH